MMRNFYQVIETLKSSHYVIYVKKAVVIGTIIIFRYGNKTQIFHMIQDYLQRPVLCYGEVVRFFKTF